MSPAQMRMVYALTRSAGIDNDTLHDIVLGLTGKESLTALTPGEGARLIDRLKGGRISEDIPNRATQKQRWLIKTIERELGWADDPARLRGMVSKMCGVDDMRFLTVKQARTIIETLKGMQRGGRGDRKEAGK